MKTSFTLLIIPTFIIFAVLLVWWMATSAALKARLYNCEIGIGVVRAVATMMALFGNRSFRLAVAAAGNLDFRLADLDLVLP